MDSQYSRNTGYQPRRGSFYEKRGRPGAGEPFRELFVTACIIGLAFLFYPAASDIFTYVVTNVPAVNESYMRSYAFSYLCEAFYSFFCVGLPFLLVYIMLKSVGRYHGGLALGKPYSCAAAVLLVFAGLGICFAGNFVTSLITAFFQDFGVDFYSYRQALAGDPLPENLFVFFAYMLRTAVVPALIEEFAFRGVVLQTLRRYGDWFAIFVSAVMFALMHANMTQVPFALIAGTALGYCFVVSGSLWTSVTIHFINNFTAVAFTVIAGGRGEGAGMLFSMASSYAFIFLGLLAGVVFVIRNPRFLRLYPGVYGGQRKKALAFFAAPTVIAAAVMLMSYMYRDIVF